MVKMEETVTTEEIIQEDGSKKIITKTVRKPATKGAPATEGDPNDPKDGGRESGDPWGKQCFCVPVLCTIL